MPSPGGTVALVMEQHLGHRTYAENLRACLPPDLDVELVWVPVTYGAGDAGRLRSLLPTAVTAALAARSEVRRGIRSADPDLVLFNTQVPAALGGRLARLKPYVVITDVTPIQYDRMAAGYGHHPDRFTPTRRLKHEVNRRVFGGASCCVGWSNWARDSIIADYGVAEHLVHVIPPGVDTRLWRPAPSATSRGPFTVLFVGGDFDRKGGGTLLRAFAGLPPDARLVLVTKSAPSAVTSQDPRITVVDDLMPNDQRLIELFGEADVFVLPSHAETFGIAAVEASAMGVPVIATSVGGLPDIVEDGVTGVLVPPEDVGQLASALRQLYDHPDRRRVMGAAARRRVEERFDARVNGLRLLEVARRAVQR